MTTLKLRKKLMPNDRMVFYDDSPIHVNAFKTTFPYIKTIKVPKKAPYSQILKGKSRVLYPVEYLKQYPDNTYAKYIIKSLNDTARIKKDNFDAVFRLGFFRECSQGLTIQDMNHICQWAQNNVAIKERTILFDWDNTLSTQNGYFADTMEKTDKGAGFNFNKMPMFKEVKNEDIMRLLMGTKEIFDAVCNMFYILRKCGVNVFILSANASTDFENKNKIFNPTLFEFFYKLIQVIDPLINKEEFVYGLDKIAAFKANPTLMKLYKTIVYANSHTHPNPHPKKTRKRMHPQRKNTKRK